VDTSSYETIVVEKRDKVATVTLNRPDRLNAVNGAMHHELEELFAGLNDDLEVNAVVLTGAGRAFCAGGDIGGGTVGEVPENAPNPATRFVRGPRRLVLNMLEVEAPIIVAMNGDAIGLGATLALLGDVIIASETARIGDTHVRVGLVAAAEAERIGLVNHVVPPDELLPRAQALAERLANGPIWAIRWTKASINKAVRERANLILDTSLALEALSSHTEDHREAARAFVEKRKPNFSGR